MTEKPAAIAASLVDIRNIAAHKCVRLEIHVPVEQAGAVMAAFGWPTAVDPVPVAIARLDLSRQSATPVEPAKERRAFCDLALSQQAALKSQDVAFKMWMQAKPLATRYGDDCAELIRRACGVTSRKDILPGTVAGQRWLDLLRDFEGVR